MSSYRSEADAIFDRLAKADRNQNELADALGIEADKVSKVKSGRRQFRGDELVRAGRWLDEIESARPSDHQPTRSDGAGEIVEIVQLDLSLSMGPGTLIEDFVESELVSFDAALLSRITRTPSDRLRFVTGIGNSHDPKFQHSDQFLIDINERRLTKLDGYYWITFEGAHGLKRLRPLGGGRTQILSDNPSYDPMDVASTDVRIEGRAIWFARGL